MAEAARVPSDGRTALQRMLEARSVAVVGASVKEATLGQRMLAELRRGGFDGPIYPVNPSYDEVGGLRCYRSIPEIDEPVDLAIVGLANARVEQAVRDAADAGVGGVVTFASLVDDEPPTPGSSPLRERVAAIARDAGMAMCGGNGMGFVNLSSHVRATGFLTPDDLRPGPVTFISHSGSAYDAVIFNDRGIGFDLIVSSGQEIATTMTDYMGYALDGGRTRVLALLLETVRDPGAFRAQLARAAELDVPVLALKVGRAETSRAMVTAHSGALAGEHGAYEAVFETYGVHETRTLDELVDAMELFSSPRRVSSGRGIASAHDSGGERALFADLANDLGIPFAEVNAATLARIDAVLDPGLEAANPLDAWGTGIDADTVFRESLRALHDDADTAIVAFVVDMTPQGEPFSEGYLQVASDTWDATTKPFCVLSNLASAVAKHEAGVLRDRGIPVLEGTEPGLRALRHLLHDAHHRGSPRSRRPRRSPTRSASVGAGASAPRRRSPSSRGTSCWPTTACRWSRIARRARSARRSRRPTPSATRWRSRPRPPGSRTSPTWAASGWISPTPRRSGPATRR